MPTNLDVAQHLGVTEAAVSRWRAGGRVPDIKMMGKIEDVYGWRVESQARAHYEGVWAAGFAQAIERSHSQG